MNGDRRAEIEQPKLGGMEVSGNPEGPARECRYPPMIYPETGTELRKETSFRVSYGIGYFFPDKIYKDPIKCAKTGEVVDFENKCNGAHCKCAVERDEEIGKILLVECEFRVPKKNEN